MIKIRWLYVIDYGRCTKGWLFHKIPYMCLMKDLYDIPFISHCLEKLVSKLELTNKKFYDYVVDSHLRSVTDIEQIVHTNFKDVYKIENLEYNLTPHNRSWHKK
eukprot:UN18267